MGNKIEKKIYIMIIMRELINLTRSILLIPFIGNLNFKFFFRNFFYNNSM